MLIVDWYGYKGKGQRLQEAKTLPLLREFSSASQDIFALPPFSFFFLILHHHFLLPQSPSLSRPTTTIFLSLTKTRSHQRLPPISFFLFSICHHRLLSVSKKSIVSVSLSAPKDELVLTMAVDPRQHHLRHLLFFTVSSTLLPCSRFRL